MIKIWFIIKDMDPWIHGSMDLLLELLLVLLLLLLLYVLTSTGLYRRAIGCWCV